MKIVFLAILVIAAALVWQNQKRDPRLPGWGRDLSAALQEAKAGSRRVLVFFTETPMSANDQHAVKNVVTTGQIESAIEKLSCLKVHLSVQGNQAEARKHDVTATPTYLLLDADGNELRRRSGLISVMTLVDELLNPGPVPARP